MCWYMCVAVLLVIVMGNQLHNEPSALCLKCNLNQNHLIRFRWNHSANVWMDSGCFLYRKLLQILMFMGVFFRRSSLRPTEPPMYPSTQVPEWLRTGDDVEWWGECTTLIEITHPKLGSCKLPLDVSMVLRHSDK